MPSDVYSEGVRDDPWADHIDEVRCRSVHFESGRRCQMYRDHDGAHGSGQMPKGRPLESQTWRWDTDDGPRWQHEDREPLRWVAFQHD